jgi:hypothetical protein
VRRAFWSSLAVLAAVATGCSQIADPGPVDDSVLNQSLALPAVVNGMSLSLSRALGYLAYTGAAESKEVVASGSLTLFGITTKQRQGVLDPGTSETNDHWEFAQQARWVAEDGVRRMRASLGDQFAKSPYAAEALVDVGFTNRLLGENMCDGVIDGGPIQPRKVYFERAEAAFTEALAVATAAGNTNLALAARAGRASVRVWLSNWSGASDDAKTIPSSFVYSAKYSAVQLDQYNRIYWANSNQPYRAHSVSGTFYQGYYLATKDPRTSWATNPAIRFGTQGTVPWLFQTKYVARDSPIDLVSGHEMRLIVAEALLRSGDWPGAVSNINQLRAEVGVTPWAAANATDAWVALKTERGIELWLEGRRLGDLSRWIADATPGAVEDMSGRDLCFPVGQNERDSNPNI